MDGKKTGALTLPESLFALPWNADLVHQVTVSEAANLRTPVADTKGRGEVRGGGKKPWQQKGTGRARAGSRRSPIWKGGGVSHGPKAEKVFAQKINKKMKSKALFTVLSKKFKDGEVLFVDQLSFTAPKAKLAKETLFALAKVSGFEKLATKRKNAALIGLGTHDLNAKKSFRNFGNVELGEIRNWTASDLLKYKFLIVGTPDASIALLQSRAEGGAAPAAAVVAPKKYAPKKVAAKKPATKKAVKPLKAAI